MLELSLLGGVVLLRDGLPVPWPQRGWQRAALFALLGARGSSGADRSELADLLWPDAPPEAARHSLDELLSRTRRDTGLREIFSPGARVSLNTQLVSIDLAEFEQAVAQWQLDRALALCKGPFAKNLRVVASPRLEQEIERTRYAHREQVQRVLRRLVEGAEARGALADAITYLKRALLEDPLDRDSVLKVCELLARTGRTAEALRVARVHDRLIADASGVNDPEVSALRTRLEGLGNVDLPSSRIVLPSQEDENFAQRRRAVAQQLLGGDYRLEEVVRETALAVVFRAVPSSVPRSFVEVYLLSARALASISTHDFLATFSRVRRLAHPGVLPVLDCRTSADGLLVVSAPVTRPRLRDRLKRGPLAVSESFHLLSEIVDAMRHAHELGVIHGDLRPKHVSVASRPVVVSAFGFREVAATGPASDDRSTLLAFGNPKYLSPEQISGSTSFDVASDIYACGCILFEMLTGAPPFDGGRAGNNITRKLVASPPSAREIRPTLSVEADLLLSRALALHAADRYPSMRALQEALAVVPDLNS